MCAGERRYLVRRGGLRRVWMLFECWDNEDKFKCWFNVLMLMLLKQDCILQTAARVQAKDGTSFRPSSLCQRFRCSWNIICIYMYCFIKFIYMYCFNIRCWQTAARVQAKDGTSFDVENEDEKEEKDPASPNPSTPNPESWTLNPQPSTLNPKP